MSQHTSDGHQSSGEDQVGDFGGNRRRRSVGRRIARTLGAMTLLAGVLIASAPAMGQAVHNSANPVVVKVELGNVRRSLAGTEAQRQQFLDEMAARVQAAMTSSPNRLITLKLDDHPLTYDQLTPSQRKIVDAAAGNASGRAWYEREVARTLSTLIDRARTGGGSGAVSVYGLPIEPGRLSRADAQRANIRYAQVVDKLDAFMYPRVILASNQNKIVTSLKQSAPESFRLSNDRPIVFRANNTWKVNVPSNGSVPVFSMENAPGGVLPPEALAMPFSQALQLLLAAWGQPSAQWDFNGDGTVGPADLAMLLGNPNGQDVPIAVFTNLNGPYTIGSGVDISLMMLPGSPVNGNVVFQVWSDVTQTVQAAYHDTSAPFSYPASMLDTVTPGSAWVQALVRDSSDTIIDTISQQAMFIGTPPSNPPTPPPGDPEPEPDLLPPPSPPGGGGGGGGGGGVPIPPPGASGPISNPNAPSPTPSISHLGNSGQAPFTLHVHALNSTLAVGDRLTAHYHWDFGDTTSTSRHNTLVGWNAGHVYDTPGTYTVRLTVTNHQGGQASATLQVNVTASNRTPIYVASTGNDQNNGTTQATAVRTPARAQALLGNDKAIYFRRGDTFNMTGSLTINQSNVLIGEYGNGAKPVLLWPSSPDAGGAAIIQINHPANNVMVQNLTLDSAGAASMYTVRGVNVAGNKITFRGCHFDDVSDAFNAEHDVFGWMTMDNTTDEIGGYYAWAEGNDHVHVGVTVGGSMGQHNFRFGGVERVLVANSNLTNNVKSCIWAMLGSHAYITGNTFNNGPVGIGPHQNLGGTGDRFLWAVVENNVTHDDQINVQHGAENVFIRNNVIHSNWGNGFEIYARGDGAYASRVAKNIHIVNNTVVNPGEGGRFMWIHKNPVNMVVANNIYVAPNLRTGAHQTANVFIEADNISGMTFKNNFWSDPAQVGWGNGWHYVWGYWSHADGYKNQSQWTNMVGNGTERYRRFNANNTVDFTPDWRPLFSAQTGETVSGVLVDRLNHARPLSGTVTVGAVQSQ